MSCTAWPVQPRTVLKVPGNPPLRLTLVAWLGPELGVGSARRRGVAGRGCRGRVGGGGAWSRRRRLRGDRRSSACVRNHHRRRARGGRWRRADVTNRLVADGRRAPRLRANVARARPPGVLARSRPRGGVARVEYGGPRREDRRVRLRDTRRTRAVLMPAEGGENDDQGHGEPYDAGAPASPSACGRGNRVLAGAGGRRLW